MRRAGVVLLTVLLGVVLGCSALRSQGAAPGTEEPEEYSVRGSALDKVEVGMSASEVESVVGRPALIERKGPDGQAEVWHYESGILMMRNGKVVLSSAALASPS